MLSLSNPKKVLQALAARYKDGYVDEFHRGHLIASGMGDDWIAWWDGGVWSMSFAIREGVVQVIESTVKEYPANTTVESLDGVDSMDATVTS